MRCLFSACAFIALLSSCGQSDIEDCELDNERIFGTVVSVKRVDNVNWDGAGNVARSAAANVGNIATQGMFSHFWNTSGPSESDVSSQTGIAYVIDTDEGKRINVLASFDRVYYPGEEVMVIRNNAGYSDVYPRDLSHRHPGGL